MLTGELRNKVDKVWDAFWTGGISNPLTVIEQITYLLFIKRLDELHTAKELKANTLNKEIEDPIFSLKVQDFRWSRFKDMDPERMFRLFSRDEGVFDFMKNLAMQNGNTYSKYMKGAVFMIPTPNLLAKVIDMLSDIPMHDRDTKGDLYEYLLSKISTAGKNGQFRTPRHIIRMMVEMVKPTPEEIICDPAAGTCGFLFTAAEYLRENCPEMLHDRHQREHFNTKMFNGNEFDATMIRIGAMNMLLHGIENPNLDDRDSLSESNAGMKERYTLIMANPPFKGSLDYESVEKGLLRTVKTKKTELLFIALMFRALKTGGRCTVIVPEGVLFGSSNAHKAIRKELIDNQKLQAVISMPSGVFKPYAGVSTAVLIFTKTESGGTDKVWFYDMESDGYSLDDKRNPVDKNDIPDILKRWNNPEEEKRERTEKSFFVPVDEIRENGYDLSVNRYKEIVYEEVEYDFPKKIIDEIRELDQKREKEINELEKLLDEL